MKEWLNDAGCLICQGENRFRSYGNTSKPLANRSALLKSFKSEFVPKDFCRAYLDRCMQLQLEEKLGIDAAAAAKYKISGNVL